MRVLVVGGGPAGTTAAVQAREFGAEVTLVEAKTLGGTSLNEGPVRSARWPGRPGCCVTPGRGTSSVFMAKRLGWTSWLRSTTADGSLSMPASEAESAEATDWPQIKALCPVRAGRRASVQRRLGDIARSRGVDVIEEAGPAVFVDPHTVRVPVGIVAVGGHAGRLPAPSSPSPSTDFVS